MIGAAEASVTELLSFEPFAKMAAKKTKDNQIPRSHPFKYFADAKRPNTFNHHDGVLKNVATGEVATSGGESLTEKDSL